ncbi:hypothetical protein BHE74_00040572 [Ensete ventricosum]|nr:hypothetical protein BHE74_00040572 [Ensete ventricosum]RZR97835.1 hypothetical protein BHM03_00027087 [Ensete ventricosum]
MGGCIGRSSSVHPAEPHDGRRTPRIVCRVKVRMAAREFQELLLRTNPAEIGLLIVEECLRGRWPARDGSLPARSLETIFEEIA